MVVYGTRPEAIKVAPLIKALEVSPDFDPVVVVTGQHREMLDQVNRLFKISPEIDLDLMVPGASVVELTSRTLNSVDDAIRRIAPDVLIVQGDTTTAFAASLAGFYNRTPVVHLEAGLRTFDIQSPFPEEANRVLTARIADLHLAPTRQSRDNLEREGVPSGQIVVTGNTVIDALQEAVKIPASFTDRELDHLVRSGRSFILVTAHRRESWGQPMREAMLAVRNCALKYPDVSWVVPMHRNPIVRGVIREVLDEVPSVLLLEPLDYHEFSHTMRAATLILTDSGGVQEEAPSLAKPVLVMRESTERPEAIAAGTVALVGTDQEMIETAVDRLLTNPSAFTKMARAVNPYGDGSAAGRSVAALEEFFGIGSRMPDFTPSEKESTDV